jgi:hypothetical protein
MLLDPFAVSLPARHAGGAHRRLDVITTALLAALLFDTADASRDRTGIDWVLPFPAAQKKAKDGQRLLLIKPIAFGTSKDGGW